MLDNFMGGHRWDSNCSALFSSERFCWSAYGLSVDARRHRLHSPRHPSGKWSGATSSTALTAPQSTRPSGLPKPAAEAGAITNSRSTPTVSKTPRSRMATSSSRCCRKNTWAQPTPPEIQPQPASRFLVDKESGPHSGCWATTSTNPAGPTAARSTSWRTSARSPASYTAPYTALDIPARLVLAPRTLFLAISALPTTSTSSLSSGNRTSSVSTSTTIFTRLELPQNCPRGQSGFTTIPSSCCSTSRSVAAGREIRTRRPFFRKPCWSTTCVSMSAQPIRYNTNNPSIEMHDDSTDSHVLRFAFPQLTPTSCPQIKSGAVPQPKE